MWSEHRLRSVWNERSIEFDACFRCEAREAYSHDPAYSQPGGGAYAIGLDLFSSEVLVEDSISVQHIGQDQQGHSGARRRRRGGGCVQTTMDDGFIDYSETWIEMGLNASHFVGAHHVLLEGNYAFNPKSCDRTDVSPRVSIAYN